MKRHELEHVLRAAGAITSRNEWVIVLHPSGVTVRR
jgi:hypothetical protein